MAVLVYTCDTCRRTIEQLQESLPLTPTRCIITHNCKGTLRQIGLDPARNYTSTPTPIEGVQDYQPSSKIYAHEQLLATSVWSITHDLNSTPIVHVYVPDNSKPSGYRELDPDEYVVINDTNNHLSVEFADSMVGIAHLVTRSKTTFVESPAVEETLADITANGILTIATPWTETDESVYTTNIEFIDPATDQPMSVDVPFTAHRVGDQLALFDTPWSQVQLITWNNNLYRVRSVRLSNVTQPNDIPDGSPFTINDPDILILLSNPPYEHVVDVSNAVVLPWLLQQYHASTRLYRGRLQVVDQWFIEYPPGIQIIRTIQDVN